MVAGEDGAEHCALVGREDDFWRRVVAAAREELVVMVGMPMGIGEGVIIAVGMSFECGEGRVACSVQAECGEHRAKEQIETLEATRTNNCAELGTLGLLRPTAAQQRLHLSLAPHVAPWRAP